MEKTERLPRRYRPGPGDVFALVKHEMADDALLQPPLLVFPHDAAGGVAQFWRSAAEHRGVKTNLDAERAAALKELADAMDAYPQYGRAVKFMRSLAGAAPYPRVDAFWPKTWFFLNLHQDQDGFEITSKCLWVSQSVRMVVSSYV